jgi:hypothetical protein
MAFTPLPDPVPKYVPVGFVSVPDHALEGRGVLLGIGPTMRVQGPTTSRMRQYVPASATDEALTHGPFVRVDVSYASAFPPEWFEGLTGTRVSIGESDGYYRGGGDHASLIVLRGQWVVEVITAGLSKRETLEIARSLDIT